METKSATRGHYESHIAAWEESGQSQKDYCRAHQLSYPTFTYWRRKLRQDRGAKPAFSEIKLPQRVSEACIYSIALPEGAILRIYQPVSADFIRQVIGCK